MKFVVRQRTGRVAAARCAALALLFSSALLGCEPSPPDGAYDASNYDIKLGTTAPAPGLDSGAGVEVEASIPIGGGAGGPGGVPAGSPAGAAGGTAGGQPGAQPGAQGGSEGGAGGTMGGVVDPEVARLQKLAGHYYMRMDMRSTVSASTALGNIRTTNVASHLLVTQLYVDGSKLVSVEQLCYQTFQHRCDQTCSRLATTMRNEVKNELLKLQPARTYVIAPGGLSLRGEAQTMYLGFDATSDSALPTATSDSRVWLNGSTNNAREGMWLYLETSVPAPLVGEINRTCDVYTVQKFVSAFEGTLKGSAQEPVLDGMMATLETAGSNAETLGATDPACEDTGGATPTNLTQTVRFARASVVAGEPSESAFWGCPAIATWDSMLPPPPL